MGSVMLLLIIIIMVMLASTKEVLNYCVLQTASHQSNNPFRIYAADHLINGTVRLYSGMNYYDLLLLWTNHSYLFPLASRPHDQKQLFPALYSTGSVKQLFKNAPPNLIENLGKQQFKGVTIYSLVDSLGQEYTALFISLRSNQHRHSITGRMYVFDTGNGHLVDVRVLENGEKEGDHSEEEINPHLFVRIWAAFRIFVNGQQYLFTIVNGRLYWTQIPKSFLVRRGQEGKGTSLEMIDDGDRHQWHNGTIPYLTAAFAIQPDTPDEETILVIINCHKYCLLRYSHQSYFDFDLCSGNSSNWIDISHLMEIRWPTNQADMLPSWLDKAYHYNIHYDIGLPYQPNNSLRDLPHANYICLAASVLFICLLMLMAVIWIGRRYWNNSFKATYNVQTAESREREQIISHLLATTNLA